MALETYNPIVLEDGSVYHGIMVHRKSARRMIVLELNGAAQFLNPETGLEIEFTEGKRPEWNHIQETSQ